MGRETKKNFFIWFNWRFFEEKLESAYALTSFSHTHCRLSIQYHFFLTQNMMEINFHNPSGVKKGVHEKMWVILSLQAFSFPRASLWMCASPEMLEILLLRLSREVFPLRIFAAFYKREKIIKEVRVWINKNHSSAITSPNTIIKSRKLFSCASIFPRKSHTWEKSLEKIEERKAFFFYCRRNFIFKG